MAWLLGNMFWVTECIRDEWQTSCSRQVSKHVGRPDSPAANLSRQAACLSASPRFATSRRFDGCVLQMNLSCVVIGYEPTNEEGSARYRRCSSLSQPPKHPDDIARNRACSLPLSCCVGQTTCRTAATEPARAASHVGVARTPRFFTIRVPRAATDWPNWGSEEKDVWPEPSSSRPAISCILSVATTCWLIVRMLGRQWSNGPCGRFGSAQYLTCGPDPPTHAPG